MVELVRVVSVRRRLRRSVLRLSRLLLSATHRTQSLHRLAADRGADHLHQRERNRSRRKIRHSTRTLHSLAGAGAGGDGPLEVAPQSLHALHPASRTAVQSLWRWARARTMALLRLRTVFDSGGRS